MEIKDNETSTLGSRIDFIIKSNDLKKADFARTIRINKSHIGKVIDNQENLSPSTIKLISVLYNINEDWLLTGEGDIYIDKTKYNDKLNRLGKEFENLNPDFQDIVIAFSSYMSRIQDKLNRKKN